MGIYIFHNTYYYERGQQVTTGEKSPLAGRRETLGTKLGRRPLKNFERFMTQARPQALPGLKKLRGIHDS